ncbi:hypothetical protein KUTeg_017634 [Tegillarca granosa]|uniref:Uncharacterized protein n=1 Tax=Tegillarca granosa TaxID=220873 RepID=A0ABQ9EI02_TEGGR|nr:hypothetical protein KUTeg_017634 [Tegillarca granosa]
MRVRLPSIWQMCWIRATSVYRYVRKPDLTFGLLITSALVRNVCPENEVVDNGICKQYCTTKDFQYILNGTCVSECPESYKIIDTKTKKVCQPICNHLKNNTVLYNNACFHDCPSSHPLRLQQKESVVCRSKCPPTYVVDGSRCITHKECSDSGRKFFESICTSTCPNNTYLTIINPNDDVLSNEIFTFQVCNYTCPKEYYKQGNNCTRCLSNSYYIYKDSCLKRCPGGTIVHKSSSYAVPNICDPRDIYWMSLFGYVLLLISTIVCIWSLYCRRRTLRTSMSTNKRYDQDQLSSLEDNDETCLLQVNDTVLDPSIPKQNHNKRYDQLSSLEDD